MNTITSNDLQVLSRYQFIENGSNRQNSRLLGLKWIKEGSVWKQKLVKVNRQDATCWSLFLSLFGLGKLKHISVSLDKICGYLSQYQWKEIKLDMEQTPEESPHKKAFKTACHVFNRHIRGCGTVGLKAVSDPIPSDFNHYWNPAMNGRFLLNLQRYRLPHATGLELRFKDSNVPVPPYQSLTKEDMKKIEVGYAYEQASRGDHHHFHYPESPYYATSLRTYHEPTRREI